MSDLRKIKQVIVSSFSLVFNILKYGYNSAHLRAPLENASPAVVETVKKIFRQSQFLN